MKRSDYLIVTLVAFTCALVLKLFVVDVVYIPSPSMESCLLPGDYVVVDKLFSKEGMGNPRSIAGFASLPEFGKVGRGDVIVFEFPFQYSRLPYGEHALFVKRCVAVSGDRLDVEGGEIIIDGGVRLPWGRFSDTQFLSRIGTSITIPGKGDLLSLTRKTIGIWADLIRREGNIIDTSGGRIVINGLESSSYRVRNNYLFVLGDNYEHSYDSATWGLLPESDIVGKAAVVFWSADVQRQPAAWYDLLSSVRWGRIGTFVR